ncbi:Z1 domain-containing protein [Terrabacter sp. MAHUQ-38]|uniref:Z1 domain-containing protein n=1 Tax=unclassified Terrabacter TaxID=2630222 RepID=UPI00165D4F62|nr:Z1 domain-containing protein [Terrabacter sp. MAHUQ-38]MBC9819732.1 alpha-1,4 polygalactosaminidase [Terrabacter sp. MAHUQ-38]
MLNEQERERYVRFIGRYVAGGGSVAAVYRDLIEMGLMPAVAQEARLAYERKAGLIRDLKDPGALVDKERKEGAWYAGPSKDDVFWPALHAALMPKLPEKALLEVSNSSNKIVGLGRPPGAASIRTRGLVLGHVQSGKTTSFMSVAAKSADVGYRLIVVLSGVTENLRSQTQERLEQQLIGNLGKNWVRLTDEDSDFQKSANAMPFLASSQHRLLAVVKKNPHRLRRLAEWLESAGEATLYSCPILIIDDEADQASIDVGRKRQSVINALIGRLLKCPKSAYLAYTATPFANLLIDPAVEDGLYPRNFIVSLRPGEGYYGPERLFGRDLLEHVEDEDIAEPDDVIRGVPLTDVPAAQPPKGKNAASSWTPEIPPSLASAVEWFLLATAARWVRGQRGKHSSMLIHTSMIADAHFSLQAVVREYLYSLSPLVARADGKTMASLRALWMSEVDRVTRKGDESEVAWAQVAELLPEVVDEVTVIVDNYRSTERLAYGADEPVTCIAIGGNTLSRGLTLEGLVSSYFIRAASAYDTLLQMGRWFGYRPGYSDLVRIWMTDELKQWFRDLATVEAEIRREIDRYENEGLEPTELAVKIRTHPAMSITAAAKMRSATQASLSFSGTREQTILFKRTDVDWLAANWAAAEDLLEHASARPGVEESRTEGSQRYVLRNVPAKNILEFLATYEFHPDAIRLNTALLRRYIEQENREGALTHWNVIVMSNESDTEGQAGLGRAGQVNLIRRTRMKQSKPGVGNIKALAGSSDRAADLGPDVLQDLGPQPSDAQIIRARRRVQAGPLLALYPITKTSSAPTKPAREPLDAAGNVLGVAFFFPDAVGKASTITYMSADLSSYAVEDADETIDAMDEADAARAEGTANIESGDALP